MNIIANLLCICEAVLVRSDVYLCFHQSPPPAHNTNKGSNNFKPLFDMLMKLAVHIIHLLSDLICSSDDQYLAK